MTDSVSSISTRIKTQLRLPELSAHVDDAAVLHRDSGARVHEPKTVILNRAYEEYCRRIDAGEKVGLVSFCRGYARHKTALLRRLELHEYLDANPEALDLVEPIPWPSIGDELGDATILEELGRGGVGRVYLAQDNSLPRELVIKASAFENGEAGRLSRLDHPNIVPIYFVDQDEHTGLNLIVMPFQSRHTLHDVLDFAFAAESSPSNWSTVIEQLYPVDSAACQQSVTYHDGVVAVGIKIAEALQHCHEQAVYHFDLKPSNILLAADSSPMLIDFGVGTDSENSEMCGGTKPYMSPEQIQALVLGDSDARPDGRSDIYSLGVILYQLLVGEHPFVRSAFSGTDEQLLLEQRGWDGSSLENLGLEKGIVKLLKRCLSPEPENRPTASELASELRSLSGKRSKINRRVFAASAFGGAFAVAMLGSRQSSASAAFHAGLAHREKGDWAEALDDFKNAILQEGDNALYYAARASVYTMRSWEILDWDPVMGIVGNDAPAKGDIKSAHDDYQSAVEFARGTEDEAAYEACLAFSHFRKSTVEDASIAHMRSALDCATSARRLGFENASVANMEGLAENRVTGRMLRLNQAAASYPDDQMILVNLARANQKSAYAGEVRAIREGLDQINRAFKGVARISLHHRLACYLAYQMIHGEVAATEEHKAAICETLIAGLDARLLPPHRVHSSPFKTLDFVSSNSQLLASVEKAKGVQSRQFVRYAHPLGVDRSRKVTNNWVNYEPLNPADSPEA